MATTPRTYGHGTGYGSGPAPSTTIRGKSVEGGDDFYIQKNDRDTKDWRQEDSENGLPEPHGPRGMTRVVASQTVSAAAKILTTKGGSAEEPDWFIIQNNASDETVYINIVPRNQAGASSNNTHFPIAPGGSIQVNSVSPDDVWAYSANGAPVSIITRF